nr:hypothetical protein CFP56_69349 [Quercus suber]
MKLPRGRRFMMTFLVLSLHYDRQMIYPMKHDYNGRDFLLFDPQSVSFLTQATCRRCSSILRSKQPDGAEPRKASLSCIYSVPLPRGTRVPSALSTFNPYPAQKPYLGTSQHTSSPVKIEVAGQFMQAPDQRLDACYDICVVV